MWLAVLLLTACGTSDRGNHSPNGERRTLTVFAAASLKETFTELERRFEAEHVGVDVQISFGGSSDLAQQIVNGAPADVFASASESTMDTVSNAGLADGQPRVFASNRLQVAVQIGNPKGISGLADLAKDGVVLVVCAPQVPCGGAAIKVASKARVTLRPVSEEPDVKSVLGKVTAGEADAGLVYVTDVRAVAGKIAGVDFPESSGALTRYPIAVVKNARRAELARQFTGLVFGVGQDVLRRAGFGEP
jgi:molybdate transport system substrate-binding protein